jgi:hypothetical protein
MGRSSCKIGVSVGRHIRRKECIEMRVQQTPSQHGASVKTSLSASSAVQRTQTIRIQKAATDPL